MDVYEERPVVGFTEARASLSATCGRFVLPISVPLNSLEGTAFKPAIFEQSFEERHGSMSNEIFDWEDSSLGGWERWERELTGRWRRFVRWVADVVMGSGVRW